MPKIIESRPPVLNQQHSYSLSPGVPVGCSVVWAINGRIVGLGDQVGGLEIKGFGGAGAMTVEVVGPVAGTVIEARIACEATPQVIVGPMLVGSGIYDPCTLEPCSTARKSYLDAAKAAIDAASVIPRSCASYRRVVRLFLLLLIQTNLVFGMVIACRAMPLSVHFICAALYGLLALLGLALVCAAVMVVRLGLELDVRQMKCQLAQGKMFTLYLQMAADCPRECILPLNGVRCDCR
jgi:hypothetical protein